MARGGWTQDALVTGVLSGDRKALARAISLVEDRSPEGEEVVRRVYGSTGRAASVGVTGPPGVGKSSLLSALVALGYKPAEATRLLKAAGPGTHSTEELIRRALQSAARE